MSKLFFEMTETEAQLQNILNSLEYAQYQMSTGINGYGNGTMTREEHQETERSVLSSLVVAMSGIQKLIGEYASLEEDGLLPEMAVKKSCRSMQKAWISTKQSRKPSGLEWRKRSQRML